MSTRNKTLLGLTVAAMLIAGVAWAADGPTEASVTDRTVIPVEGAGTVTLEVITGGLAIVAAEPDPGWTVTVQASVGAEVEAHFESDEERVDVKAQLADGRISVEIERRLPGTSSTTVLVTTPSTSSTSTSTATDDPTSTTAPSTSSTVIGDDSTTTTVGDPTSTTSTTLKGHDGGTTSTTRDDRPLIGIPDGIRTFEAGVAGSVTVELRAGALSLVSVDARHGWTYEIEKSRSDDIEVEFSRGDAEVEIRIRADDGRLEVRVDSD